MIVSEIATDVVELEHLLLHHQELSHLLLHQELSHLLHHQVIHAVNLVNNKLQEDVEQQVELVILNVLQIVEEDVEL
jgi:hypothetical protein